MRLEVNCLACTHCDPENDRCRLYGSDPDVAVARCAEEDFKNYHPVAEAVLLHWTRLKCLMLDDPYCLFQCPECGLWIETDEDGFLLDVLGKATPANLKDLLCCPRCQADLRRRKE